jgi:DNA-binding transcriptional LysR family regulator
VFPDVDVRHLQAVVVLAEELNFTRAAQILRISQPALSKQITELEEQHRLQLFVREKGRIVELTDAGRVFVQELPQDFSGITTASSLVTPKRQLRRSSS